jgi:glycosyltransferase involved in cell wall biosynthesis
MMELSVVLIAKNQAWNISRLIESVLREISSFSSKEIVLVDSASVDETLALASLYPINIFRLKPGQQLSPSIGRYVGYKQTHGEYVLFLDGDTELISGWLPYAMRLMCERPEVGAVTGRVFNLPTIAATQQHALPAQKEHPAPPKEVLWCNYEGGGAAMYRRSTMERVGCFNPNLFADEEAELGLRIRHGGYRLFELDYPMVYHYNDAPVALSSVLSRRQRNFHLGMGQVARCHLGTKLFWTYLGERWFGTGAVLLLVSCVATILLSLIMRDPRWFLVWALGFSLLIAYGALRKRSLRAQLISAFRWLIMAEGFFKGIMIKSIPPESFRANLEVVKAAEGEREIVSQPMSTSR